MADGAEMWNIYYGGKQKKWRWSMERENIKSVCEDLRILGFSVVAFSY